MVAKNDHAQRVVRWPGPSGDALTSLGEAPGPNEHAKPLLEALGSSLSDIANLMNVYMGRVPLWDHDSVCAGDHESGSAFADLRDGTPGIRLAVQPLQLLSQARTNVLAISQVIREPDAVPAALILMRPIMASCGSAYYLLPGGADSRERARRAMNSYLCWTREALNYLNGALGEPTVLGRMNRIVQVARSNGFRVSAPGKKVGGKTWPEWHIGDRVPSEMDRLSALIQADQAASRDLGRDLFRLMSAATHAQPHAMYAIARLDSPSRSEPLDFNSTGAFNIFKLVEWMYAIGALLNRAVILTGDYYGWGMNEWEYVVHSRLSSWRDAIARARQSGQAGVNQS